MDITYQGKIGIKGLKLECTSLNLAINTIVVNNLTGDYKFTLKKFEAKPQGAVSLPIYEFLLDEGDLLVDDSIYALKKGDYLELLSDIADTTYYIEASSV